MTDNERYRLAAISQPHTAASKPIPLRLNRNFLNFPIARDARTKLRWRKSKKTGRWVAALPGEDRILLSLPRDIQRAERRGPTAGDVNVLFAVLAEVQRLDAPRVTVRPAAMMRRLGLAPHRDNRAMIGSAVALWSRLRLQSECWYEPEIKDSGRRVLPPPIVRVERKGQAFVIDVHETWLDLALVKSYFASIPLPLPNSATVQNAALMILTSPSRHVADGGDYQIYFERRQSSFARKMGLSPKRRRERLTSSLDRVSDWFEKNGGDLMVVIGRHDGLLLPGKLRFVATAPTIPRLKAAKQTGRSRSFSVFEKGRSRSGPNAETRRSRSAY